MEFYITNTGEKKDLHISDRKSGLDWTSDLIGNSGDLNYNREEERYEMTSEDYDWWSNTIEGLNKIDDLTEEAKDLLSVEDFQDLQEKLYQNADGNDHEKHIASLTAILNEVLKKDTNEIKNKPSINIEPKVLKKSIFQDFPKERSKKKHGIRY